MVLALSRHCTWTPPTQVPTPWTWVPPLLSLTRQQALTHPLCMLHSLLQLQLCPCQPVLLHPLCTLPPLPQLQLCRALSHLPLRQLCRLPRSHLLGEVRQHSPGL